MIDFVFKNLLQDWNIPYKANYNLSGLTWLKTGGVAEIFVKISNLEMLSKLINLNKKKFDINILGAGSNIIISDSGVQGIILKLIGDFTKIQMIDNTILVGAGCLNFNLVKFAQINSLSGFEFLSGIPGTLGGAICTNAGAYHSEIKDLLLHVEAIDKTQGKKYIFSNEECKFSYRSNDLPEDLIFTQLLLKAKKGDKVEINNKIHHFNNLRVQKQPQNKTCGSVFLNPPNKKVWELIDLLGLRGKQIGGAKISDIHCNFIQNFNNATSQNIFDLIKLVKNMVMKHYKIDLKLEVKILGYHNL